MEKMARKNNMKTKWLFLCDTSLQAYELAKDHVCEHRSDEFWEAWEPMVRASETSTTEHFFMREYTWCVYVSGFSATTIAKKFDTILQAHRIEDENGCFLPIGPDTAIWDYEIKPGHPIMKRVLSVFKNFQKAKAVQETRRLIHHLGWESIRQKMIDGKNCAPENLAVLPYMGPALSCQLARNLGNLNVVKPDVHLKRLAQRFHHASPQEMCAQIAEASGDPPGKVDLTLWMTSVDLGSTG